MFKHLLGNLSEIFIPGMDISYSRISAYEFCPVKYRLIYQEGWRVPPTPYISLGLSVHRALEEYHSLKNNSLEILLDCYNKNWVNEGFSTAQETQEFFDRGEKMLLNYFREQENSKTEIVFIEKAFRFKLGRNHIIGIIDRIDKHPDGKYEVIDYKTHSQLWEQQKADSDLQLTIYSMACKEVLGFTPEILSFYFLAFNKKISTLRTNEQLKEAEKTIEKITREIYKGSFEPNKANCVRCDFRKKCSLSISRE